jgi:hypothetical protein
MKTLFKVESGITKSETELGRSKPEELNVPTTGPVSRIYPLRAIGIYTQTRIIANIGIRSYDAIAAQRVVVSQGTHARRAQRRQAVS